jgi:succinate dehydrogenase / fumarate reductase, membrane anchor subunit
MQRAVSPAPIRPNRSGAFHAWRMHLTTWILLVLSPLGLGLFVWLAGKPHSVVIDALERPYVALPLAFIIFISVWHMALGMRTIIEDYIRRPATLAALLGLNTLFAVVVMVTCVWSLVQRMIGL